MKTLVAAAAVLLLAGCASAPKPSVVEPKKKAPVVKVASVEQPTAAKVIKKRWYDGFRERWFNK